MYAFVDGTGADETGLSTTVFQYPRWLTNGVIGPLLLSLRRESGIVGDGVTVGAGAATWREEWDGTMVTIGDLRLAWHTWNVLMRQVALLV